MAKIKSIKIEKDKVIVDEKKCDRVFVITMSTNKKGESTWDCYTNNMSDGEFIQAIINRLASRLPINFKTNYFNNLTED